jgi:hypothetical protein
VVYGLIIMLLIAAGVEAFWSSARWLPLPIKYSVAAVCWIAVLSYLCLQGRSPASSEQINLEDPPRKSEEPRAN